MTSELLRSHDITLQGLLDELEQLHKNLAVAIDALEYIADRLHSKDLDASIRSRKALDKIKGGK